MEKQLILNRWATPDGRILTSHHKHDFVSHKDANGKTYAVDGGVSYVLLSGCVEDLKNLCVFTDRPHDVQRISCHWGKRMGEELVFIPVSEMDTDHIEAVLSLANIDEVKRFVMENEIKYRSDNPDLFIGY